MLMSSLEEKKEKKKKEKRKRETDRKSVLGDLLCPLFGELIISASPSRTAKGKSSQLD